MHDQEAAVQQTFHLERSSFFYLSVLMVSTYAVWHLLPCILDAAAVNPDTKFCPPEVKPHPQKTTYTKQITFHLMHSKMSMNIII